MDSKAEHDLRNRLNQLSLQMMALDCELNSDSQKLRQLERVESLSLTVQQLVEDYKLQLDPDWLESRVRVLVVEDDACQRNAVVTALQELGVFVAQAADGAEAVGYLHRSIPPDVVLMDIEMPECGGTEANLLIKHIPLGGTVKVIAVTARSPEQLDLSSFDGFVQKPYHFSQLVEQIRSVVKDIDEATDEVEKQVSTQ